MTTFEKRFYTQSRNPLARLWRDLRLIVYLGRMAVKWFSLGRKLRRHQRAYGEGKAEKLHVDKLVGGDR